MLTNETKSLRSFGYLMSLAFLVIGVALPYYKHHAIYPLLAILSVLFLILALLFPQGLKNFYSWWIKLGDLLGFINSRILFTLIYATIFSFVHLVFVLLKRDRLKRKWKFYQSTYVAKERISSFSDPF